MMNNHDFISLIASDGFELEAYIAFPESDQPFPAIILLQEAFGVNTHIRSIADRLCAEGFGVIAPDLFHRTAKRIEVAYTDIASVYPILEKITIDGLSNDLIACYTWLQQQENVNKDKIGSIGFCLGGRVSFLANAILPLAAGISYYGGGLDKMSDYANRLHGAHLFFWGGLDTHISTEKIDSILAAVKAAGKDYTSVMISYAEHGFNCDERKSYHPKAAKEAWAHTLAFFRNRLLG